MRESYTVYVKIDVKNRIIEVNSSAFVNPEWGIKIDKGNGDRYHHAQGNYFDPPLYTEDGIPRYKLQDGKAVERTEEEIQADREARPKPEPAPTVEELQAKITALTTSNQMLEDCLVEMAGVVYG